MRCLYSLELRHILLFFPGIAIRVILKGEFAVLLLDVVDGTGVRELEVGIVVCDT